MYFKNRHQAGMKLATDLKKAYGGRNTAVLCLSEGALLVGAEISRMMHSSLNLLLTQDIEVPGEKVALGEIDEMGTFTYNRMYSPGQLESFNQEYLNHIEAEKMRKLHAINRMLSKGGFVRPETLQNHVVIVVTDGANSGLSFNVALSFLKPIKTQLMIAASPIASIDAVDQMHTMFDDIKCVSVVENYIETSHYYDDNDMPTRSEIVNLIETAPLRWVYPRLSNKSVQVKRGIA